MPDWIPAQDGEKLYYFQADGASTPDRSRKFRQIEHGVWLDVATNISYVVGRFAPNKGKLIERQRFSPGKAPVSAIPYGKASKSFNMIGRAAETKPNTKVYYDSRRDSIANILDKAPNVTKVPLTPNRFRRQEPSPGKMFTRERDGAYKLSETPFSPRTPLGPPKTKRKTQALSPVPGDVKHSSRQITMNTRAGSDKPDRATAMSGWSAAKYAASCDPAYANARWEWLHLVGHALGGRNEIRNLVAGTFDANSGMIPVEQAVLAEQKNLKLGEAIEYHVRATLIPGTHVATEIVVTVTFPPRLGREKIEWRSTPTSNTKTSKIHYNLMTYDSRRKSGGTYGDTGRLTSSSKQPLRPIRRVETVFTVGMATGSGNNCLLDTLNQLRTGHFVTDWHAVKTMRSALQAAIASLRTGTMLNIYGPEGIQLLNDLHLRVCVIQIAGAAVTVHPVIGDANDPLVYLLHQGLHFSPLRLKPGMTFADVAHLGT